jgi:catechol 2,3-dioxygenase-like lactoylglutathione lyase family enzyme
MNSHLKLGHIEIFVNDTMKSKDFYVDVLGFELIEVQGGKFVWLKMGESKVLLRPGKGTSKNSKTYQFTNIALVIYTDDAEKAFEEYKNRGLEIKADDTGCPVFTDLDGNWFQLVNPEEH